MANEDLARSSEKARILHAAILELCRHPWVRNPDWLPTCGFCGQVLIGWKPEQERENDDLR